jgi:hypothetical protein
MESMTNAPAPTGGRRRTLKVKTLKRKLRAAGVKTTGRKATLLKRAKKAHIKLGGALSPLPLGGRRRSRRGGVDEGMVAPAAAPAPVAPMAGRRRRSRKLFGIL